MRKAQEEGVDISKVLSEDEAERTKELAAQFDEETSMKAVGEEKEAEGEAKPKELPVEEQNPKEKTESVTAEPAKPAEEEKREPQVDFEKQIREKDQLLSAKEAKIQELETLIKSGKTKEERMAKIVEADKAYGQYVEQRSLTTMKEIDALSEDDPDYDKKIAAIRAKEASDIKVYERQHPELVGIFYEEPPAKPVTEKVIAQPAGEKKEEGVQEQEQQLREFTATAAQKAGLDPKDATFLYFCRQAPTNLEDGTAMPFEDQVVWAIERTKNDQLFVQTEVSQKGVSRQKKELPLGRGTGEIPRSKEKEFRPVSISDALEQVRQERTL